MMRHDSDPSAMVGMELHETNTLSEGALPDGDFGMQHDSGRTGLAGLFGAAFLASTVLVSPVAAAVVGDSVAVRGGTVMNASGEAIEGATVLMEDGVIKAVGKDVEIPYDAKVYDAEGKTLFPGMVLAHTSWGLDRANESLPVTPFVDTYDAIDPSATQFEESQRVGITTLHIIPGNDCVVSGLGRVVRPVGMLVEEMTVRAHGGVKVSITPKGGYNRMTQMSDLRKAFADYEAAMQAAGEKKYEETQKEKGEKVLLAPDEAAAKGREMLETDDVDQRWRTFHRMKNGELSIYLHCDRAGDVLRGIDFMTEAELMGSVVFVLGTQAHEVVDVIKGTGRPVVLSGDLVHRDTDPITGEVDEVFVPKVFADAGVPFALQTSSGSMGEGFLWYQAARLVREGLTRDLALGAITQVPADIIGLGDQLGSIAPGKHGNVVILSGDPLAQSTVVEKVLCEGALIYDRATDRRLKDLLSGQEGSVDGDEE